MRNSTTTPLSKPESDFLRHMMMFGSAGYPVQKMGRCWIWEDGFWGIKGPNTTWKTKREAFSAVERYVDSLVDRAALR